MRRFVSGILAALPVVVSCSPEPQVTGPDVVVIVIDTLRADHLPFYGYERDTAPFLASLAERSAVFESAWSTSSWTAPAAASLFTSMHPVQHGVLAGLLATQRMQEIDSTVVLNRVPSAAKTLPEVFREAGYETLGISDNLNISEELGFREGFDEFMMFNYRGAEAVNEHVLGWEGRIRRGGPYFLYVHYMDPHYPYYRREPWYQPQEDLDASILASYDSEIRHVDERIRELYEFFGWGENTLLVVTSDHGEEFQDHGGTQHGQTLYEEVLRVPLLVHGPSLGIVGRRIEGPASVLDVLPTLRAFLELPADSGDQGISLLPAARGMTGLPERPMFSHVRRQVYRGGLTRRAVVLDGWKYIRTIDEGEELYDLTADPHELSDRRAAEPRRAAAMDELLSEAEASWPRLSPEEVRTSLDPETVERLRTLGYVE